MTYELRVSGTVDLVVPSAGGGLAIDLAKIGEGENPTITFTGAGARDYQWATSPFTDPVLVGSTPVASGKFVHVPFVVQANTTTGLLAEIEALNVYFLQLDYTVKYTPDVADGAFWEWECGPGGFNVGANGDLDDKAMMAHLQQMTYSLPIRRTISGPI